MDICISTQFVSKEMEKVIKEKLAGKITHEQLITLADAIARRELT
ncbi:TPA: hypothetical protein ACQUHH_005882 [Bacillus mobilis]